MPTQRTKKERIAVNECGASPVLLHMYTTTAPAVFVSRVAALGCAIVSEDDTSYLVQLPDAPWEASWVRVKQIAWQLGGTTESTTQIRVAKPPVPTREEMADALATMVETHRNAQSPEQATACAQVVVSILSQCPELRENMPKRRLATIEREAAAAKK